MRKRGLTPVVLALSVLLIVAFLVVPASASASSTRDALSAAVASGTVDAAVVERLQNHGAVRAIVTVDGTQALAAAESVADAAPGSNRAARALLSRTVPAYEDLKTRLPEVGTVVEDYVALPTSVVRFDSEADLLAAAQDPTVTGIREDDRLRAALAESLPLIHQPQAAAAGHKGAGTSVAVLDTGVDYTRAAFGSCSSPGGACKVAFAKDFAPADGVLDSSGHGTNVSAIALGVAPGAKILSLDVIEDGWAYTSDVMAAIDWTLQNKAAFNIVAVNLSLSNGIPHTSECPTSSYTEAFANLRAAGVMPVVAAGNSAFKTGSYEDGVGGPACTPGALRVGATYDESLGKVSWGSCVDRSTAADLPACFSQGGPMLSVWAPGAIITAAGITYGGTSQATPHVAGAVAVAAEASPGASVDDIQAAIMGSGPLVTDNRSGVSTRRLDVAAAVNMLLGTTSPEPTPGTDPPETTSVRMTGRLIHTSGHRGSYALLGLRRHARYLVRLTPVIEGQQVTYHLERKRRHGSWKPYQEGNLTTKTDGTASLKIRNRQLRRGARYRVIATYPGDAELPPVSTTASLFRLKRR